MPLIIGKKALCDLLTCLAPSYIIWFVWNLQHMAKVAKGFCWPPNFVPMWFSVFALGLYTLNHEKCLDKIKDGVSSEIHNKWSECQSLSVTTRL